MPMKPPNHRYPHIVRAQAASRRAHDKARGSAAARGYDGKWRAYAKAFLERHPWCQCERCQMPGATPLPAQHVDHDIAVSGPHDPLFWQASNHRAMAHPCHSRKTARFDGAFGNALKATIGTPTKPTTRGPEIEEVSGCYVSTSKLVPPGGRFIFKFSPP